LTRGSFYCYFHSRFDRKFHHSNEIRFQSHINKSEETTQLNHEEEDGYYVMGNSQPIRMVKSLDEFKNNFNSWWIKNFSDFALGKFVIAGGSVFNAMTGNKCYIKKNYQDLDLFLITRDQEEAVNEIKRFAQAYQKICKGFMIIGTGLSITFVHNPNIFIHKSSEYAPTIQIVLRLYHNITQVISGFDLDSCCVAYDGNQIYAMPRFFRSLKRGYNLVDPERQSKNYSQRLIKYLDRGVGIALPGYDPKRVHPSVIVPFKGKEGLAKLLHYYNHFINVGESECDKNKLIKVEGDYDTIASLFFASISRLHDGIINLIRDAYWKEMKKKGVKKQEKNGEKKRNEVNEKKNNSLDDENGEEEEEIEEDQPEDDDGQDENDDEKKYDPFDREVKRIIEYSRHHPLGLPIKYSTNLKNILKWKENRAFPLSKKASGDHWMNIVTYPTCPLEIEFITQDPSSQIGGSFHPVFDDWYKQAYEPENIPENLLEVNIDLKKLNPVPYRGY